MRNLPNPPSPDPFAIARFCRDLIPWLRDLPNVFVTKREAVDSILLQSQDGSVYQITVTNAGVVTSTLVASP